MNKKLFMISTATIFLFTANGAFAQAFGEYGRTLGGMPYGGITAPRAPGGGTQGATGNGGVGDVGGRGLPARLVVVVESAGLYPRQDDESERLAYLSQGEGLVPMVKSTGGNDWYMVKTQKGLIGWVKSADVKEELLKK